MKIIVEPKKLRNYKKENLSKENRLHYRAKKQARKIAKHFNLKLNEEIIFNPYILDLYIHKLKIGFEIDGSSHNEKESYDNKRDDFLWKQYGITVLRFSPDQIDDGTFKKVFWEYCYRHLLKRIQRINSIAKDSGIRIPNCFSMI